MKKNLKKEFAIITAVSLVITGVFLFVHPSFAGWGAKLLTGLIGAIISGLGVVVGLVIEVLIRIAQYNDFTNARAIEKGWLVVRDLANMFFILVFLIIAFATILRVESYNYKKHLPKLLLMAVFINFSKTIAGLIIDFGQVAMITFVNGFKDIGAGNLVHMLGLTEIMQMKEGGEVNDWTILSAYLLALLYMIVALVTIVAILAVLVMRMVMLWIYVVLSPLAFLLAAFPGGKKYSSMWWSNFSKEVIVGPVLAFFIWLSFVTVSITTGGNEIIPMDTITDDMTKEQIEEIQNTNSQISKAATSDVFIKFIISIGMLVGGLVVSKQIGATAGSAAGTALNTLNSGKSKVLGAGRAALRGGVRRAGRGLKTMGSNALDRTSEKVGMDLNVGRVSKRWKAQRQQSRTDRQSRIYQKSLKNASSGGVRGGLAMLSTGDKARKYLGKGQFFKAVGSENKINKRKERLNKKSEKISTMKEERGKYMSNNEHEENVNKKTGLENRNKEIDNKLKEKKNSLSSGNLNDEQEKAVKQEIQSLENEKKQNSDLSNNIDNKLKSVNVDDKKASQIDNKIESLKKEKEGISDNIGSLKASKVSMAGAQASADAEVEAVASKDIAHTQDSDDLVAVIKDAIDKKDKNMAKAAYKKLAKTGNSDKLNQALNLGTDHKGMSKLAKKQFQEKAGMSEQESLSLMGEVEGINKGLGKMSGFGHVTMEDGNWRESSKDERDAAAYTEASKINPRKLALQADSSTIGSYKDGAEHTSENFQLNKDFIALVSNNDPQYAKEIEKNNNPDLINNLATTNNIKILKENGAVELAKVLEKKLDKSFGDSEDSVKKMLKNLNLDTNSGGDSSSESSEDDDKKAEENN
ncbi:MAG TPA: hypothetical protein VJ926_03080 [Patescibacteria group bacterium]|nr:hypothetical protein [Patescibacteria group bacterium]